MEVMIADLHETREGKCDGCGKTGTLDQAVMEILRNDARKDATGKATLEGKTAWLVCTDCSDSHPMWHREKAREDAART